MSMLQIPITQLTTLSLEHPNLPITHTSDEVVAYHGPVRLKFEIPERYKSVALVAYLDFLGEFDLGRKPLPEGLKAGTSEGFSVEGWWHDTAPVSGVDLLASMTGAQIRLLNRTGAAWRHLRTEMTYEKFDRVYLATTKVILDVDLHLCHEL